MAAIPNDVKRTLRQEAGFGCCVCGHPIIEYHHVLPRFVEDHNRTEDMMAMCPWHHDEATKGSMPEEVQRHHKANPHNVGRGYAEGLLRVNHEHCAISCGSVQLVNDDLRLTVGDETLLRLRLDGRRVLLSVVLNDENDTALAVIEDNEWVAGDADTWDLQADYQRLIVRTASRDIRLGLDVGREPMFVRADLWNGGYRISLRPAGLYLGGNAAVGRYVEAGAHDLCFVAMNLAIEPDGETFSLVPGERYGSGYVVSEPDPMVRLMEGINALNELRGQSSTR